MAVDGWRRARLGEVLTPISRVQFVESDRSYPLLGVRWYGNGCHLHDTIPGSTLKTPALNVVDVGDVTYNKMWVSKGAFAVVDGRHGGLYATSEYPTFKARLDVAFPEFLRCAFKDPAFVRAARESCRGTTSRARLNPKDFLDLAVPLPPLSEQRKIAAILSSVDDAIEATQAVIDQLQVVKKAMMAELLTRGFPGRHTRFKETEIGEIPEEWHVVEMGKVAKVGNGSTPSRQREDFWVNGTIPWLPTGKVNDRNIIAADQFVTAIALEECPIQLLPPGTLLVAMIGQGKTRGMVAHLSIPATVNQNFAFITPRSSILPWFLFAYLEHQYEALRGAGRGSNQGALNCSIIKAFHVPLPPLAEQQEIERALLVLEDRLDAERTSRTGLVDLKAALMSVLLTGEVRVTPDEVAA